MLLRRNDGVTVMVRVSMANVRCSVVVTWSVRHCALFVTKFIECRLCLGDARMMPG